MQAVGRALALLVVLGVLVVEELVLHLDVLEHSEEVVEDAGACEAEVRRVERRRARALAAFRASCIVAPRPGLPRPLESLTRDAAALVPADAFAVAETALAGRPSDDNLFDRVARRLSRDARPLPPSLAGVADALEELDGADSRRRIDESLRLALRLRVLLPLRAARFAAVVPAAPRMPQLHVEN